MPKRMTQEDFNARIKDYTNDSITVVGEYKNKKTPVLIQCKKCNYKWYYSPASLMPSSTKNYHFKGCPNCKKVTLFCLECGKEFTRLKTEINDNNFCCKTCANRYKNKQKINKIDSLAYRRNAFEYYPHKCDICGWDKDERVLEVHHLDEDRTNNHINNLRILCPNCHKFLTLHLYSYEEMKK